MMTKQKLSCLALDKQMERPKENDTFQIKMGNAFCDLKEIHTTHDSEFGISYFVLCC